MSETPNIRRFSDLDIPLIYFCKMSLRILLLSQTYCKVFIKITLGERFKCYTNEHHRRAHEEVSENASGESWNHFKAEGYTSKNRSKAGYCKVAYFMGFVLPVHWMRSCKNSSMWLCNWRFFSIIYAQGPKEG